MNEITLIYFSPTKTTQKILREVAKGYGGKIKEIDLTLQSPHKYLIEGTIIVGAPVYAGRLPEDFIKRFTNLDIKGTKSILSVVYGNRDYDDALLELKDYIQKRGSTPIGAGAFVAEHSLSTDKKPIGLGRPDKDDLAYAYELGKRARKSKTKSFLVPGNRPYKNRPPKSKVEMVTDPELCTHCGKCIVNCPVGAIDDPLKTDGDLCLRCCACVRVCKQGARKLKDEKSKAVTNWLIENCQTRKESELFI